MIFIAGDTHGNKDTAKLDKLHNIVKPTDFIIVLGDFGLLWYDDKHTIYEKLLLEYYKSFGCTVLWLDGNHENFERVDALPETEMYGGKVGVVADNLYHLKRGEVFTIEGKTFFVMGGADSIDKFMRTPFVSWWARELPTMAEFDNAIKNLDMHNRCVDYVLTHDAPTSVCELLHPSNTAKSSVTAFLEEVNNTVNYKHWYFGHHHTDIAVTDKMTCVYNVIYSV